MSETCSSKLTPVLTFVHVRTPTNVHNYGWPFLPSYFMVCLLLSLIMFTAEISASMLSEEEACDWISMCSGAESNRLLPTKCGTSTFVCRVLTRPFHHSLSF